LVDLSEGPLTGPDGRAYLGVSSPTEGYVPVDQLDPEDSTGPRPWEIEPDPLAFSPDGDGSVDALGVDVTWSEDADWTAKVEEADGTDLDTWTGDGDTASFSWDGLGSGGVALPDGSYTLTVRASDTLGNAGASTAPVPPRHHPRARFDRTGADAQAPMPPARSPNGDGQPTPSASDPTSPRPKIGLTVRDDAGVVVRHDGRDASRPTVTWDSRADDGSPVAGYRD
jgi:hypothetical protein